jgi:O-antigen/teichoic acid export membrane protein
MLVDFDKVMIPQYLPIAHNAVYSVAIFIATVIAVPYRAMNQIVAPITARLMVQEKWDELQQLYQKTSINLQITGGLLLVLILTNIHMLYRIIPDNYDGGVWVVFMIGISKYYDVLLGNNNAIIVNTRYYRMVLFFGVATVVLMIVLNAICIPMYGINGSALATLLTIMLYNTVKFVFVVKKLKLFPFTLHTVRSLVVLIVVFGVFYAWDFPFHPIINIVFKSALVAPLYLFAHYYLRVSEEVNEVIDRFLPHFLKR